jgi:fatty acid-binding protein DegV
LIKIVEKMFKKYDSVIFLPISKGLSSQWQSAQIIKHEYPNFYIINSRSAAYTNEIILENIVSNIKKKKTISEIITDAEKINDRTFNIFSVEETSGMKSGGRITSAILKVIDVWKLQPIIRLNTKNEYAGITKNYQNGIEKMIRYTRKWCETLNGSVKKICIYTSGFGQQKFDFIKSALMNAFHIGEESICTRWIPSTVLVHTKLESYGYCAFI